MIQRIKKLCMLFTILIMGYIPFHALISTWLISNFDNKIFFKSLKDILVFAMFGLLVGVLLIYKKRLPLNRRLIFFTALYFAVNIIYLIFSAGSVSQRLAGFDANLRFLSFFLIAYLAGVNSKTSVNSTLRIILASLTVVSVFAVLQSTLLPEDFLRHLGYGDHTIQPFLTIDGAGGILRYSSTLRGPNVLGSYLLITIPLLIVCWVRIRNKLATHYHFLLILILLISLAALFFTYSRSAWLGLVVALITMIMFQAKYRRILITAIVIAVFSSVIYAIPNRNSYFVQQIVFHSDPNEPDREDSDIERVQSIQSGLSKVKNNAIGHGIGSAGTPSTYGDNPVIIENYFLDIAYQFGYLGLVLLLAIYYYTFRLLWAVRQNLLAISLIGTLVGLTISGMFWPVWSDETIAYTWWGLAGIVLGKLSKKPLKL